MNPYSYTNPHASGPGKIGLYHDLVGEYEDPDTIYTITVLIAPQTTSLSRLFAIPPTPANTFKPKVVKLKAHQFPHELRCSHLQSRQVCGNEQCYLVEGGLQDGRASLCRSKGCDGHAFNGRVKIAEDGRKCFGKREKIVCIEY